MHYLRRTGLFILVFAMLTGFGQISSYAKTKINTVNIKVEAEIQPDTEYGKEEIDVTIKTGKCTFSEYEILNEDNEWSLNMVPKIQVILEADDNYYFPSDLKASKIKISGGTYVSAIRAESNTQLKITMTLPSLMTYVGSMGIVSLTQDGVAEWEPVLGAAEYYIRLYRDGKSANTAATTHNTTYNFNPSMLRAGAYSVRVRAINGIDSNNKSEDAVSNAVSISEEMATSNRLASSAKAGEWIQDEMGWWYNHSDGTYTASGWEKIRGTWYAFDESGYMRTGWVVIDDKTYYLDPETGALAVDTVIEDRTLGEDGAMISLP